jgi:hypothetical protein
MIRVSLQRDIVDSIAAQHGLVGGDSSVTAAAGKPKDKYYADATNEEEDTTGVAFDELLRMARQLSPSALARLVDAAKNEVDKQPHTPRSFKRTDHWGFGGPKYAIPPARL